MGVGECSGTTSVCLLCICHSRVLDSGAPSPSVHSGIPFLHLGGVAKKDIVYDKEEELKAWRGGKNY